MFFTEGDDECHPVYVVDLGEELDVPITQPRIRGEEGGTSTRRDPFVEGDEPVRIGRPDRA